MPATTITKPPTGRAHLPSLTGIRVPLALLVFTNHAGVQAVFRDDSVNFLLSGPTAPIGEGAVAYFFALSGFVLTWSMRTSDTPRIFIRRRLAKIVPNHLLTWVIGFVLLVAVGDFLSPSGGAEGAGEHYSLLQGLGHVLPSLFLVHSWVPSIPVIEGTNGPSWSLSAELFFYLCFPFVVPFLMRIRPARLWRWLYVIGAMAVAVPFLSLLLPKDPIVFDVLSKWRFWLIAFAPPVRALDFVLGVIVARIVIEGLWRPVKGRWIVASLLGAWVVSLAVSAFIGSPYAWIAPFFLPIVLLLGTYATRDTEGVATRFSTRRMVWLGEVTFPFYVLHWLVIHYAHRILFDDRQWGYLGATLYLAGCLIFTTVAAGIMFEKYEKPLYFRWSKKGRRSPDAAVPRERPVDAPSVPESPAPALSK